MGIAYSELGRFEDAVLRLKKSVQFDPDYVHAWVGIGVAYARLGRKDDAKAALTETQGRFVDLLPMKDGAGATGTLH